MYILTESGKFEAECFIRECEAKRKEILDADRDTADETTLPTVEDIVSDLNYGDYVDEDGEYYNAWGVTDNYESDSALHLSIGIDFVDDLSDDE